MAEFILTWNPTKWTMPDVEYNERLARAERGEEIADTWSTGGRTGGIIFGHHAYLLRQHHDRGLIARGRFVSEVYQDDHWDGSDRTANFADLVWSDWLSVDDRLPLEQLKSAVPALTWDRVQGSGVRVPQASVLLLDALWAQHLEDLGMASSSAEEVFPSAGYPEGAVKRVEVNRYERDPRARAAAIAHHGLDCVVCGFNFASAYGALGEDFVHVHHVRELALLADGYVVDPEVDLVPLCANCHSMIHRQRPALTPDALRQILRPQAQGSARERSQRRSPT